HFPKDKSVGRLHEMGTWGDQGFLSSRTNVVEAQGTVLVDRDELLKLEVSNQGASDLSFIEELEPDALMWLDLSEKRIEPSQLKNLRRLTGLGSLNLSRTGIHDDGLRNLAELENLHDLDLRETCITDDGTGVLAVFRELRSLDLSLTSISDLTL